MTLEQAMKLADAIYERIEQIQQQYLFINKEDFRVLVMKIIMEMKI
jgi:hypothetical protein